MSFTGSIRFRILAAFLAAMTAMLSALVFLMVQYRGVSALQGLVTEGYLPLDVRVDQLLADQQRIETDIDRLLQQDRRPRTGDDSLATLYSQRLLENVAESKVHARQAASMTPDPVDLAALNRALVHLDRVHTMAAAWRDRVQRFVQLSEAGEKAEARTLAEPLMQDGRALGEEIGLLSALIDGRIQSVTHLTETKRRSANTVALSLTVAALVVSLALVGAVLAALRPIGQLTARVQRLAKGDYTEVPSGGAVRGGGEIAVLAGEFDRMVEALQHRDRTLVERAEQLNRLSRYLASVLDSLEDALFVVESDVVTLANPAAERRWGVHQDQPPPAVTQAWVSEPGAHEVQDGRAWHEVRVHPFGDAGAVVVTADVTEQRQALEQLARSERLALVGQMLAQITHEVRNPLNALSLNAEMLSDELAALDAAKRSEAWDLLGTIVGEIERLTRVTEHYLQLARRPPAQLRPEDLRLLVEDVVRLVNAELERQGITIDVHFEPLAPQRVDGNQLRQALLNVMRNAAEAGARTLSLTVSSADDEVLLTLRDDGPGMTHEEVDRAFDPFFSTKADGTGLGLAITRQILEDHGGTIRVESAAGGGTSLILALPARPAAEAAAEPLSDTPEVP